MKKHVLILMLVCFTHVFAQMEFSGPNIIEEPFLDDWEWAVSADMDMDGDKDIVANSTFDHIVWFENLDGKANFDSLHIIHSGVNGGRCVAVADIDGDNDPDVLYNSRNDDYIAWCENTGDPDHFENHIISNLVDGALWISSGDFDGDGDQDVVSASFIDNKIAWYENTDGTGSFGTQQVLDDSAMGANYVQTADLDCDGDLDILASLANENEVVWYENTDGKGVFSARHSITTEVDYPQSLNVADLDDDGFPDVLSASYSDNKIAWYPNIDGKGTFGPQQVLNDDADGAICVAAGDLNSDGDLDVFYGTHGNGYFYWQEKINNSDYWGDAVYIDYNSGIECVGADDFDADGDLDLYAVYWDDQEIIYYENQNGIGDYAKNLTINNRLEYFRDFVVFDLDNDNDQDILVVSYFDCNLYWYENTDGSGNFIYHHLFSFPVAYEVNDLMSEDLNGDGRIDFIITNGSHDNIYWFENNNTPDKFISHILYTKGIFQRLLNIIIKDVDNDADKDVLMSFNNPNCIIWIENNNNDFSQTHTIASDALYPEYFSLVDMDSDSDPDVLVASEKSNMLFWYENMDSMGNFGPKQFFMDIDSGIEKLDVIDLNSDGLNDIVVFFDSHIKWYENPAVLVKNWIEHELPDVHSNRTCFVDIDNDNDLDFLSYQSQSDNILFYENQNNEFLTPVSIINDLVLSDFKIDSDLDGDGYKDLIYRYSGSLGWYKHIPVQANVVNSGPHIPEKSSLMANYPNPFNANTFIEYQLDENAHVELEIYNIHGEFVTKLVDFHSFPGLYRTSWNGSSFSGESVSSGVYFYSLKINGQVYDQKRMLLLK